MLSNSDIDFLTSQRVARIATIKARNKSPHLVPICFAFDGKSIFTTLGVGSQRLKNVEQGSKATILVDEYEEEKSEWKVLRGLLIYGNTKILTIKRNRDQFMHGWKLLIHKYPQYKQWANADLTPKDPDARRIMKIELKKIIRWGFG